jgi:hypothetical protein
MTHHHREVHCCGSVLTFIKEPGPRIDYLRGKNSRGDGH